MPGSFSNEAELLSLNFLFNSEVVTRPNTWFLALYTDAADENKTDQPIDEATSVNCPGYERQSVTFGTASSGQVQNTNTPVFTATSGWITLNYFGIWTALTGGTLLVWGSIDPKTLANTDQLKFDPNQLTITQD